MRNLLLAALVLMLGGATHGVAQDVTISDVSPNLKQFKGVQAVDGLGYYCFVMDEKSQKGFKLFTLHIWDYELNQVAKSSLELEKKSEVVGAVYNGSHFLVVFYDAKSDNVRSVSFDESGNKVAETVVGGIKTKFMFQEDMQPSFYAAGEAGFYAVIPDKEKKFGFSITRYDNQLNEMWVKAYFPEKGVQVVMDAESDADQLVLLKYSKDSKMTKETDVDMTAFAAGDGSERWTYSMSLGDRTLLPNELAINDRGDIAVAGMYFDGSKVKASNSDGVFFTLLTSSGAEIAGITQAWDGELQKFLRDAKNSITAGKPKVIFEDIAWEPSTNTYRLVGELFAMNTMGKVMNMLQRDATPETKITIEDLVVFTFSGEGELLNFYSVDKARTHITLPSSYAGGLKIANALKQTGNLAYKFIGTDENGDLVAFYTDYVKQAEDGSLTSQKIAKSVGQPRLGLGMLNLNKSGAGEPALRYLPLSKKADKSDEESEVEFDSRRGIIDATKSKPGYVLISQFNFRTQELNLFLEKMP